jgi:N4-gp56 family major capsid protein
MKSLEELGTMTTGDISDILPKIIIMAVEEAARARRFGRVLVKINTDLVGKQGRSINIPMRGVMTAAKVSEGSTLNAGTATNPTYATINIQPFKIASNAMLTQEALDASEFDLIKDHIMEAGEALADLEDLEIIKEFLGIIEHAAETHEAVGQVVTLDHNPIYKIVSVVEEGVARAVASIDSWAGKYSFTGGAGTDTVVTVYWYINKTIRTQTYQATTISQLAYEDIVKMATAIRSSKWSPNFMVLNPQQMSDLIKDNRFVDASRYGSTEPLLTGEVGKIGAMKLLCTTQIEDGTAFCVDSTRAAYLVIKRNLDMKRWDNPSTDAVELYFYFEFAPKVVNPTCVAIVVDTGSLNAHIA